MTNRITRRRMLGGLGAAGALAALPGCRKRSGSKGSESGESSAPAEGKRIKIGLVLPQAGVYAPLGVDMQRGWELFLEKHGGKLGGHAVETITADEGDTPQTGVSAVQKLIQGDQVDVVVGIVSSAVALGSQNLVKEAKKLLIVSNAGAGAITGSARTPYIWRSSFTNAQISSVMGEHLAKSGVGPVYALAPDYAAGTEVIAGFKKAFEAGGGKMAGETKPPFGRVQDYQPFLTGIRQAGAKATFCFFSGAEAVAFVKQYAQFGLAAEIPLYGSGFLTEGSVLESQADAALGIQTTLHYSTEIDVPANREFVAAYRAKYQNATPTCFTVQTYDAANVLHRALGSTKGLDGDSLAAALETIGEVDDSPRGPWSFDGQSPKQRIYLRKVEKRDGAYVNAVVQDLGVFSQVA